MATGRRTLSSAMSFLVRPIDARDLAEVRTELVANWHSPQIWSLGRRHQADELPGFVAEVDGAGMDGAKANGGFAGLITMHFDPGGWQCEVITLSARLPGQGVGAALLAAAEHAARERGCRRIYLTTTNDNTRAIRFYQRCGWRFAMLHKGLIDVVRSLGVDLPATGFDGIPVHDEIEFERWLG